MLKNKLKKFTSYIFAEKENLSLENRLFLSSILIGIFISTIASIMTIILSIDLIPVIISCGLTFLLFIVYYFARIKKIIEPFIIPILLFSIAGIFIIWIYAGGMHGQNMLPAFVILILALIILPQRKKKYLIFLFLILIVIVYLIVYYKPDLVIDYHSEKSRWIDSFATTIYSALCIYLIILFFHKHYTIERLRAEESENKIKMLLAEKEIILKEVHHRIKNNMSTINAFLILQADIINEPSAIKALEDAGNRVQSMMVLYDKLYRSAGFNKLSVKEYLPSMIDEIVSNFPNRNSVKIVKNIDDFLLDAGRLQPLGIIINEIITNSMKYAFMDKDNGIISITASLKEKNATFIVEDNGPGLPESIDLEHSTGFGLQLLRILTEQLKGTIQIERAGGTKFIIGFLI